MEQDEITPVILCGGSGTRLWPRSRPTRPKPFLQLIGEGSLFQQTLARSACFANPVIVTGEALVGLVKEQLGHGPSATVIVEPEAKNTAAAIALAAYRLPADTVMLVCPSDHYIADESAFVAAARQAAGLARQGWLVCLTAEAHSPETGYGYVRRGRPIDAAAFEVAEFVEKPDETRARSYLASGEHAWNAGIFVFRAGDFLSELAKVRPLLAQAVRDAVAAGLTRGGEFHPDPGPFSAIRSESVDYAVFENTDRAAMIITDMKWSDIGSWPALRAARDKSAQGNTVRGRAELVDCRNVLVDTDGPRVVALGLQDVIIAIDGDEIVVASADRASEIGEIAKRLSKASSPT